MRRFAIAATVAAVFFQVWYFSGGDVDALFAKYIGKPFTWHGNASVSVTFDRVENFSDHHVLTRDFTPIDCAVGTAPMGVDRHGNVAGCIDVMTSTGTAGVWRISDDTFDIYRPTGREGVWINTRTGEYTK